MSVLIPTVVEATPRGERLTDLYSRLLGARIIFLGTAIDDTSANLVVAQLLHLAADHPSRDINLYINSPGGDMTGLFAIYDTMCSIRPDVATTCVGPGRLGRRRAPGRRRAGQALRAAQRPRPHPPAPRRRPGPVDRPRAVGGRVRRDAPADGARSSSSAPARPSSAS